MRVGLGLTCFALFLPFTACALGPPPPRRHLTFTESLQVRAWRGEVSQAVEKSRFAQAALVMGRIIALRERAQGRTWWETTNARLEQESWLRIARLSAKQQQKMTEVLTLCAHARGQQGRDPVAAEKLFRRALALCRSTAGEENAETANCYANIAGVLDQQGQYHDALPLFRKALASSRAARGDHHPSTASRYLSIGSALDRLGRHDDARPYYLKALAIRRATLGEDHPDTGQSYNNVATNLDDLRRHPEAERYFQLALVIHRRTLGEAHPETHVVLNNLALNLHQRGHYARAQPILEQVLAARLKVRGPRHLETALSYNSLGGNLYRQGKADEARVLFEKALAIRQVLLSDRHPIVANSLANLASCYSEQGEMDKARGLLEQALSIRRVVLGDGHPLTIELFNNLALALEGQGRTSEAIRTYRKCLDLEKRAGGKDRLRRAMIQGNLALSLARDEKTKEAREQVAAGLDIVREAVGERHQLTGLFYHNLGGLLRGADPDQALRYVEKALDTWRALHGENHPKTAQSYQDLAIHRMRQGKLAEAEKLFDVALKRLRTSVGDDHLLTAHVNVNAGHALALRGDFTRAATAFRAAIGPLERDRLARAPTGFDRSIAQAEAPRGPRLPLAACLARLGKAEAAWAEAEAGLARGLLDDWVARPEGKEERDLLVRLRSVDDRLLPLLTTSTLSPDRQGLRSELRTERRSIQTRLSQLAIRRSQMGLMSRAEVQRALPDDGALLLWVDAPFAPYACILRKEGPPRWALMPGSGQKGEWTVRDAGLVKHAYESLTSIAVNSAERTRRLNDLRQQRLRPIEQYLKAAGNRPAIKRLFVIPTGLMELIPAELLAPELVVSYVPSASVYARLAQGHRKPRATPALALGDPAFDPPLVERPKPPGHGLLVLLVLPGSVAARADLQPGDVILSYDGSKLTRPSDLRPKNARVVVKRWREGKEAELRLEAGPLGVAVDPRPAAVALPTWREGTSPVRGPAHRKLPGSRWEAESLRDLLGAKDVTLLLGSDASEQELDALRGKKRLNRYRLIHFGTHGVVDWDDPQRSALILAQDQLAEGYRVSGRRDKSYSGRLTVGTILREWQLDADLVVLSACETGLGLSSQGEGPLGFAQAFLQKGARSVMLSRWKVDDAATALLMRRFYENLLGKTRGLKAPMGRAAALNEAKKWLRELARKDAEKLGAHLTGGTLRGAIDDPLPAAKAKPPKLPQGDKPFAHPYYWAAFVLVGDAE